MFYESLEKSELVFLLFIGTVYFSLLVMYYKLSK
jgi:hypothetical protein